MPLKIRTLVHDFLVPLQTEPLESFVDRARACLGAAGAVGVFDAEEKLAAVVLREQPVEQSGARTTDVQVSRRRRRESKSVHAKNYPRPLLGEKRSPSERTPHCFTKGWWSCSVRRYFV